MVLILEKTECGKILYRQKNRKGSETCIDILKTISFLKNFGSEKNASGDIYKALTHLSLIWLDAYGHSLTKKDIADDMLNLELYANQIDGCFLKEHELRKMTIIEQVIFNIKKSKNSKNGNRR